jgi:hypothetical protein
VDIPNSYEVNARDSYLVVDPRLLFRLEGTSGKWHRDINPHQLLLRLPATETALAYQGADLPSTDFTLHTTPTKPVVRLPVKPVQQRFRLLQKWEGEVVRVESDSFVAILRDKTNPNAFAEEVTIDLEEISDSDRELVEPGAIFYWSIGYEVKTDGQRTRASSIRFRRVPYWTSRDLTHAEKKASEVAELLGWNEHPSRSK